ncbi:unnamed protein product [Mytilus coruscus]|uniref:Uncharacterized protein n=1 Tax=Mytilus coruscus TaxID=42192 RepID=A0A6J8DBY7_MYTCO|nr:unnamed protein product [Mytilus coruscus]
MLILQGGRTPLMLTVGKGHLEVVRYLVTQGKWKDTINVGCQERTPGGGGRYLITQGSQLDVTDRGGWTPLMWAALFGHLEVVTFLVTKGSQLEAKDKDGETALHYAARYGRIETTKWLIDQGCSPWEKTKKGQTPYDLARIDIFDSEETKKKKKEVMDFLKVKRCKCDDCVSATSHLPEKKI